jgi:hypothetical protein
MDKIWQELGHGFSLCQEYPLKTKKQTVEVSLSERRNFTPYEPDIFLNTRISPAYFDSAEFNFLEWYQTNALPDEFGDSHEHFTQEVNLV